MPTRRMPASRRAHDQLEQEVVAALASPDCEPCDVEPRATLDAEVAAACGQDEDSAHSTLRVVLAAISDRLTPDEAQDLSAQLPRPWKEVVTKPRTAGVQKMDRAQFVGRIARDLGCDVPTAIRSARVVFRALERHVSLGETRH